WSKPHDDPPDPLRKYMELDLLVTRDANWWPDFPTSARRVADLYGSERDIPVEAIVAADVHAAARLLEALAPLELPGGGTLERGAVEEGLRQGWGLPDEALLTDGEVLTATAPYQAIEVAVRMTNKAGEAWIDEVTLERLGAPGANLVENGSFEEDADADGLPDGWTPSGLGPEDGLVDGIAREGERSLYLVGEVGREKALIQRLPIGGEAGDAFRLAAYSRTLGVEAKGGPYDLMVRLVPAEGEAPVDTLSAGFPCFTHEWASAGTAQVMLDWWSSRKDVIGLAAGAAASRLMGNPREVPWLDLLATTKALLDERHIQIYARDPALQGIIEAHGWAGAMAPATAGEDYLLVVDSNLGYNKVTASVSQTLDYVVSLGEGAPHARLTLTYENRSAPRAEECDKFKQYAPTYQDMTQGCYWDYVRVYAPPGARLIAGSGGDEPVEALDEAGRTVFGAYLVLAPGERREVQIEYALPEEIGADGVYRLTAQKQGGTAAHPLQVIVEAPNAAAVASAPPATESSSGRA
ncbi:MAG: DUF4012 domain-containing protein, partial [Chloroflexi bacterium]|nr:DUF4012 domain-containing protein [Chloroflexota bacterium]